MREIKFRLWNGAAMEPVGTLTFHTDGSYHVNDEYPVNDIEMESRFGGNRYHLMQFTGLHDKNGKEIYEWDIVKDCSHTDMKFAVQWDDEWAGYKLSGDFDTEYNYPLSEIKCEVIGNIYES